MNQALELRLAKRMARLGTETAFEILVKARALEAKGRDIVHLVIGEPDFDTPGNIIGAATDALHKGFTHYRPSAGLPQLRETIAERATGMMAIERNSLKPSKTDFAADVASSFARQPIMNLMGATGLR